MYVRLILGVTFPTDCHHNQSTGKANLITTEVEIISEKFYLEVFSNFEIVSRSPSQSSIPLSLTLPNNFLFVTSLTLYFLCSLYLSLSLFIPLHVLHVPSYPSFSISFFFTFVKNTLSQCNQNRKKSSNKKT